MLKCPFCQFDNEDGALFCEQCKSDLAGIETVAAAAPAAVGATAPGYEQTVPLAPAAEPQMATAAPVYAETVSLATAEPVAEPAIMEAPPIAEPPPAVAEPMPAEPMEAAPPAPAMAEAAPPPAAPPAAAPAAPPAAGAPLPEGAQPKLVVIRGVKLNVEYPIYEGLNFIGRADEKPVDVDLEDQEPPDRIWSSRQHACISFEAGILHVEDLNSSNGTFVNRTRVYPGQKRQLNVNDVIQIGTVQLKLKT
jgi:hypothetical protein